MDVKEFNNVGFSNSPVNTEMGGRQRRLSALSTPLVSCTPEAVELNVDSSARVKQSNETRARTNNIISVINLTNEATEEMGRLTKSIDGIAEQVEQGDVPQERRDILEAEANDLVSELKRKVKISHTDLASISEDSEVRKEIEATVGKALELLSPKDESEENSFGIGDIKFDSKEHIVDIRVTVAEAQQRIEKLQEAVKEVESQVKELADTCDVAIQNSESSKTSIRELSDALKIANETGSMIAKSPAQAFKSAGPLDPSAVRHLVSTEQEM